MHSILIRSLLMSSLLITAGCGGGVKLYSVTGVVTYKNAPIEGAEVALSPVEDDSSVKPARGTTDASGNFSVLTFFGPGDDRSGALPGKYKVTLQKIPQTDGIVDPYKPGGMPKNELPAIYASSQTTPFEKEVTAAGPNHWTLELTN